MTNLNKVYSSYGSNKGGLIVLAFFRDAESVVKAEVTKLKILYPCVASTGSIAQKYGTASATPWMILINPSKKVVEKDPLWFQVETWIKKYNISTGILKQNHTGSYNISFNAVNRNRVYFSVATEGSYSVAVAFMNGQKKVLASDTYLSAGNHIVNLGLGNIACGFRLIEISNSAYTVRHKLYR